MGALIFLLSLGLTLTGVGAAWLQAPAVPEPLSGGGGWLGAGLLGLVLAWLLLKHLPAKDAQISALIEAKDQQIAALLEKKWQLVEKLTTEFRETMEKTVAAIVAHCEKEAVIVHDDFRAEVAHLREIIVAQRAEASSSPGQEPKP